MKIQLLLFLTTIIVQVFCKNCTFEFEKNEKECAAAFKYTPEKVYLYYNKGYPPKQENDFNLFVECLWHRWKFLDQKGNIKYSSIKSTHNDYLHVTGICNYGLMPESEYTRLFREAVDQCEREAQADYRAETSRLCIAKRYKERLPKVQEIKEDEEKGEEGDEREGEKEDEEEE
ncbi:hypothetical protein FQA39_LY06024 [Lamprigera yunnana]|nr:hypothetical protein FQA39_LY06024 [Lamprigera yunnana]